jgi:hypothetical protein
LFSLRHLWNSLSEKMPKNVPKTSFLPTFLSALSLTRVK